ncbi:hypothetical protein I5H01_gp058 [Mycobacterium phage MarkPhew]|uniref:Uncharacterized protein n=1 Tax=Mycobacterium phage MarkPhew TaxID=2725625 RepID=A0A6M3SXJ7_9CAUD|nr:hypothetical protein I5H01_gp058 [Mycobacterium phage MarkPhew]QJD50349.1 hypothetical protein SEA_MARKPHEW_49 [Mycobacterium phage MarkPhew]
MTAQPRMASPRRVAAAARLRIELNTALRERAAAIAERDSARLVVSAQAERIRDDEARIAYLTGEREQADAAYRATLADLGEAHRQLDELNEVPAYDGDASEAAYSEPGSH